jgi:fructose 1,6-bisphosphate aldolase/phosphatase
MFPILVAGWCRGSHYGAWYPCSVADSSPTYFDGPPRIVAVSLQLTNGRFQGQEPKGSPPGEHVPVDFFAGSCWDPARTKAVEICDYIRRHGPIMPAVVPPEEMEYTTRPEVMKRLLPRLKKYK